MRRPRPLARRAGPRDGKGNGYAVRTLGRARLAARIVIAGSCALATLWPAGAVHAEPLTHRTAATPVPSETVRGVVERLSVEQRPSTSRGTPAAALTTWIRSGARHIAVTPEALAGVPTGASVVVALAPPAAATSRAADGVRRVLSVTVVHRSAADAVPRPAPSSSPQAVTAVLALPAGAAADGMTAPRLTSAVAAAARYWSRASGGRIAFTTARTVNWTRLQHACTDIWGIWDEARSRTGFVPGTRRHLLVYVPPGAGCPSGLGTVAPTQDAGGYALVGGAATGLIAHELGHNLGLGHSDALTCAGSPDGRFTQAWQAGCTHDDYGDWYDVMGISWDNLGSLSTAHAYRLGLLDATSLLDVTGPARAVLRPVSGGVGLRSLRITDATGAVYVVEYRPAAGADAWIGSPTDWRGLRPGVLVRRVDPQDPTRTLLLDATPSGAATAAGDWDRPLGAGESLRTAAGRVTIRVESQVAAAATVVVDVDGASPAVLIEPRGRLIGGAQVTVGDAPAAWAAASAR